MKPTGRFGEVTRYWPSRKHSDAGSIPPQFTTSWTTIRWLYRPLVGHEKGAVLRKCGDPLNTTWTAEC